MNYQTKDGKIISDRHIRAIHRSLVDFGYTSLTLAETEEKIAALAKGEDPTEIIGMMAQRQLQEAGLLP